MLRIYMQNTRKNTHVKFYTNSHTQAACIFFNGRSKRNHKMLINQSLNFYWYIIIWFPYPKSRKIIFASLRWCSIFFRRHVMSVHTVKQENNISHAWALCFFFNCFHRVHFQLSTFKMTLTLSGQVWNLVQMVKWSCCLQAEVSFIWLMHFKAHSCINLP